MTGTRRAHGFEAELNPSACNLCYTDWMTGDEAYVLVLSYLEDEMIERWHTEADPKIMSLPEWMGLTEPEYALWVQCDWTALAEAIRNKEGEEWRNLYETD